MQAFKKLLLLSLLLIAFTPEQNQKKSSEITVATASSLILPIEHIKVKFEKTYNIDVRLISASSGVIAAQILHGAPFDLFVSADIKYPQKIYQKNLSSAPPEVITWGALAIWSKIPFSKQSIKEQLWLKDHQVMAIANPDMAPIGRAAVSLLQEHHIYKSVESNLVYGENAGQVNHFIQSGAVDLALTAASAMSAPQLRETGYWKLFSATKIPQGALLLDRINSTKGFNPDARLFMEFLHSRQAKVIFQQFGYSDHGISS